MKMMIKSLVVVILTTMFVFVLGGCKEPEDSNTTTSTGGSNPIGGDNTPIGKDNTINRAEIIITAPVKGIAPDTTGSSEADNFTIGTVSWSPTDNPFKGGIVYTASVTLTANSGYTFEESISATVNGETADVSNNTGATVTLTYIFPETDTKTVTRIEIKTQPTNLIYTHGDTLSLAGLVVTLIHDDTTTEDVLAANFTAKSITTNPANGNHLTHSTDNDKPVRVSYGDLHESTNNLTVNPKTVNISAIQGITAPITGGTPVTVITENEQYSGTVTWNDNPSAFAPVTQYTATITLTPKTNYTLQGVASNFFTVAGATTVNNSANSGVITAVFPQTAAIPIKSPEIIITAPVKGIVPDTMGSSEADNFTIGTVSWSPEDSPFKGGIVYTASVMLTAEHGFTFTGLTKPTINGETANVSSNTGATVTLTYTFPETDTKTVTRIEIKTQPTNLIYTHGDTLSLAGLVVTLIHDDTTTEDVPAANFTAKSITTNPANGNHLTHSTDNGNPVRVSYGDLHETTNNLTVNPKTVNISAIQGITAPITGGTPVTVITENEQYSGTVTWNGNPSAFAPVTQYTATITLTPKTNYTLQGVTSNFFTVAGATTVNNSANSGVITAVFPQTAAIVINIAAIQGVTAPVNGATPVTVITENEQYSGTITWNGNPSAFAPVTQYTATITLTPKTNYTLQGVTANFFTVAGATTVSNSANSGTVTASFPATAATVINMAAIPGVTAPVTGAARVTSITSPTQYTCAITWKNAAGTTLTGNFAASTVYTATITLTARNGYTLQGVTANFFTVAGATSVSNAADSGVITAVFPATDPKTATPTATPGAGTYRAAQSVTLSTSTVGATIYYTRGTTEAGTATPTSSSTLYSNAISISSAGNTVLKAIAINGTNSSDVMTVTYTINIFTVLPTLTLTSGNGSLSYSATASNPTGTSYDIYYIKGSYTDVAYVKANGTKMTGISLTGSITGLEAEGVVYSVVLTVNRTNYDSIDTEVVTKATWISAPLPTITVQPQDNAFYQNGTLSVTASVPVGGALSYQWFSNTRNSSSGGTEISGATGASYTVTNTGYYYVNVINTISNNGDGGPKTMYTTSNIVTVRVEPVTVGWAKSVSGNSERFRAVAVDSSGNIYAVGSQYGTGAYDYGGGITLTGSINQNNPVLVKYNSSGVAQWAKSAGSSDSDFKAVAVDSSGNIYAAGSVGLVKYNSSGTVQWTQAGSFYAVAVDSSGNIYVTKSLGLVKYNSSGTVQWTQTVSGSDEQFSAVAVDSSGNIYAAGYQYGTSVYDYGSGVTVSGSQDTYNAVLVKYNSSGVAQWAKSVSRTADNTWNGRSEFTAVTVDSSGIYAAGNQRYASLIYGTDVTIWASGLSYRGILVKYDSNGTAQWAQMVSPRFEGDNSFFRAVAVDSSGVYVVGSQGGINAFTYGTGVVSIGVNATTILQGYEVTSANAVLVKYNSSGVAQWAQSLRAGNDESVFSAVTVNSSGVYAVGYQTGNGVFTYGTTGSAVVSAQGTSSNTNAVLVKYNK